MGDPSLEPIPDVGAPFVAGTRFNLATTGYVGAEYVIKGQALAYERTGSGVTVVERADFATRILVYRPVDDAAFNGAVWVEWLNVSAGLDSSPDWIFTHREMMRRGSAWVGVSAQRMGLEGGDGVGGLSGLGLVGMNPARYGQLHHPGDRFSYDIYAQAGAAVRRRLGTILDGLVVDRVLAIGESQAAFRLTTYANDIDPVTPVYDGFLVHARGAVGAPLDDSVYPAVSLRGDPVTFRSDLRVPVLCVESETDLVNLGYLEARQDDDDSFVLWEMAGTSHGDVYTFVVGSVDNGHLPIDELAPLWRPTNEIYGMVLDRPVNTGPQHYVMNAAVSRLERWVIDGSRPAAAPRLDTRNGILVLDDHGNVRGGIRTPHVDVPIAALSGLGNGGHPIAFLCGSTLPFDRGTLGSLYASRDDYLQHFAAATAGAVANGFVLPDDAEEITAVAAFNSPL
jgi:alpha/beta hydrolase family protein